jgi:hypothetical protein
MALVVLSTTRASTAAANSGWPAAAAATRVTATEGAAATAMHRCTAAPLRTDVNTAAALTADANTGAASTATGPTVPARAAAPAQAPTEGITAPVPAGAAPAIKIPAVAAATENILGVVDHVQIDGRVAETRRQTTGRRLCGCHGCGADEGRERDRQSEFFHILPVVGAPRQRAAMSPNAVAKREFHIQSAHTTSIAQWQKAGPVTNCRGQVALGYWVR